jgi:hypothetical protein
VTEYATVASPGTAVGPAAPATAPTKAPPETGSFFAHCRANGSPSGPLSNATRYLCAAAYLDAVFANRVIGELIATHRAVVPSIDIDLVPIIRHCLNARRMQLTRSIVLTLLLLAGAILATLPTIAALVVAFMLALVPGVQWDRRSVRKSFLAGAGTVGAVALIGGLTLVVAVLSGFWHNLPQIGLFTTIPGLVLGTLILLLLFGMSVAFYYSSAYRILGERLGPGAQAGRFPRSDDHTEERIARVDAAQHGNVTLYAGENPFIGSGPRNRAWSIAVELDRAGDQPAKWPLRNRRGYVPIDPAELHAVIRGRLLGLRDPELPANERVAGLSVADHIVGEGQRQWDNPLIDPVRKIPYSQASPAAVDALIRHPQAGLRYYQRVCVTDEGQPVLSDGREVIGRTDQEIMISSYIYVAVEGRMLYLQFVSATLPPVLGRYHIIDLLPKITSGVFALKVFLQTVSMSFGHIVGAPFGVLGTLLRMRRERGSFEDEAALSEDYLFGDVGARISVRELGTAARPSTYIQKLDVTKYTGILERLVTDTVLDFLEVKGVDTTAYRSSALAVINSGVMITGGTVSGPVAAGQGAQATAHSQPSPARTH